MPLYNKLQLAEQVHAISYSISFKPFLFFFIFSLFLTLCVFLWNKQWRQQNKKKKTVSGEESNTHGTSRTKKKKKRKLSLVSNQNKRHFSFFTYPLIKDEGKESDTVLLDHALFFVNKWWQTKHYAMFSPCG